MSTWLCFRATKCQGTTYLAGLWCLVDGTKSGPCSGAQVSRPASPGLGEPHLCWCLPAPLDLDALPLNLVRCSHLPSSHQLRRILYAATTQLALPRLGRPHQQPRLATCRRSRCLSTLRSPNNTGRGSERTRRRHLQAVRLASPNTEV